MAPTATVEPVASPSPAAEATPTEANASAAAPTSDASAATSESATAETERLVLTLTETEARYRVREQLANRNLPNDAVGVTTAVTGKLVMETDGTIVQDESKFVVDLSSLRSDSDRRDNFIRNNTLQTGRYPTAEFVPTEVRNLPTPLPTSGDVTFQLVGDLTLRDVTRSVTWDVEARIEGNSLVGSATTQIRFDEFGMEPPRAPILLSVEDTIQLELDFNLTQES